jgi:multicomponent Na+:H+ antiporter subunit F
MSEPLASVIPIVMAMLSVSVVIAFVRLLMGPSLPDRVVALDLVGLAIVAVVATYSIYTNQPILLRAATALALISFLGTVAFAYYVQRKGLE